MAVAEQSRAPGPQPQLAVAVGASAAVELFWATMTQASGELRVTHPALVAMAQSRPDLVEAINGFWGSGQARPGASVSERSFPELLVLADRAGVLAAIDFDELVAGLGRAVRRPVGDPALASEAPQDRTAILGRLETLRSDRPRRRAWLDLLAEVAAVIAPSWVQAGLDLSRRAARARSSQLAWTDPADAVVGWANRDYDGLLPALLAGAARSRRPVLVVPSYWSGNGLFFDLDRHLLVGIPAQLGPADSRARTERWVRGLKALSDPTRLAMLDYLGGATSSISDLASQFGLAQPTASRHVRLLRDAGLVTETRRGSTVLVAADAAALARLVDGLGETLVRRGAGPRH
jgi:ArsR family transcriptional regulator